MHWLSHFCYKWLQRLQASIFRQTRHQSQGIISAQEIFKHQLSGGNKTDNMTCCLCFGSIIPAERAAVSLPGPIRGQYSVGFWPMRGKHWIIHQSVRKAGGRQTGEGAEIIKIRINKVLLQNYSPCSFYISTQVENYWVQQSFMLYSCEWYQK